MVSELRKPLINESDDCAKLIYISGPNLYNYIFIKNKPSIYELIKLLYKTPGNPYSKDNAVVEVEDGKIRGLLLGYPAGDLNKLGMQMLKCVTGMIMISGIFNILTMMFRLRLNKYFPGTENDEFFISNLAVFEEYRRKGIALKLLKRAEEIATEKRLSKLSLYVEIDNSQAIKVYKNFGFQEVKRVVLPNKYSKHGLFGFNKLLKIIE